MRWALRHVADQSDEMREQAAEIFSLAVEVEEKWHRQRQQAVIDLRDLANSEGELRKGG
jgi:hypothetical protein